MLANVQDEVRQHQLAQALAIQEAYNGKLHALTEAFEQQVSDRTTNSTLAGSGNSTCTLVNMKSMNALGPPHMRTQYCLPSVLFQVLSLQHETQAQLAELQTAAEDALQNAAQVLLQELQLAHPTQIAGATAGSRASTAESSPVHSEMGVELSLHSYADTKVNHIVEGAVMGSLQPAGRPRSKCSRSSSSHGPRAVGPSACVSLDFSSEQANCSDSVSDTALYDQVTFTPPAAQQQGTHHSCVSASCSSQATQGIGTGLSSMHASPLSQSTAAFPQDGAQPGSLGLHPVPGSCSGQSIMFECEADDSSQATTWRLEAAGTACRSATLQGPKAALGCHKAHTPSSSTQESSPLSCVGLGRPSSCSRSAGTGIGEHTTLFGAKRQGPVLCQQHRQLKPITSLPARQRVAYVQPAALRRCASSTEGVLRRAPSLRQQLQCGWQQGLAKVANAAAASSSAHLGFHHQATPGSDTESDEDEQSRWATQQPAAAAPKTRWFDVRQDSLLTHQQAAAPASWKCSRSSSIISSKVVVGSTLSDLLE